MQKYINAYMAKGQLEQAILDYDKAIELNPNDAKAYYAKAICYNNSGYNDEAFKAYKLFLQVAPLDDPKVEHVKRFIQSIEEVSYLSEVKEE